MERQGLFITTGSTCGIRCGSIAADLQHSPMQLGKDEDITHVLSASERGKFWNRNANVKESLFHCLTPVDSKSLFYPIRQEDLIFNEVSPFLDKGHVVICDQCIDGIRTQSVLRLPQQPAGNYNGQLFVGQEIQSHQPDLTFVLDIEPLQAPDSTLSAESNKMFSDSAIHESYDWTHTGLTKRADSFPDRIKLLDASHPRDLHIQHLNAYVFNTDIIDAEGKNYH